MKKWIFLSLFFSLPLSANQNFGVGDSNCTVTETSLGVTQSLDSLTGFANEGTACRYSIDFVRPMRIVLEEPLRIEAESLLMTGADMSEDFDDLRALGVVIDGRPLGDECVVRVTNPQETVLTALTIYVARDNQKAICNEKGQSVLDPRSVVYNVHYAGITICRGEGAGQCLWNVNPYIGLGADTNVIQLPDYVVTLPPVRVVGSGGGAGSSMGAGGMPPAGSGGGGVGGMGSLIDNDGDGVFNTNDACLNVRGSAANSGCPEAYCIQTVDGRRIGQFRVGIDQDGDGIDRACDANDNLTPARDRIVPPATEDLGGCSLILTSKNTL